MNNNDDKHGFSGLSSLVSDTERPTQSKAAQNSLQQSAHQEHYSKKLPGEGGEFFGGGPAKENSGVFFSGILKFLLAIPWQLYLIGGVVGYFYFQSEIEDREISSFQSKVNYYVTKNNESKSLPTLKGGVVPIDLASTTVDNMLFRIKEDYKPKSADEVSFVVGFNCSDQVVGSYSDGASGYQKNCDIYVIDVRSHTWAYAGNFMGSEPPTSKKGGGSRTGSHPASDYLRKFGVM
ncbi:hypothetical protein [Shewanella oncorhynchi]|uniref:hypothetical protein n=1 Tax=Shewanella oncorhynchi TaxID=2726434 RepID=UPI003D7992D8